MQNLKLKTLILGKFRGKIEILITHNRKFAAVFRTFSVLVRKLKLPAPTTFLTDDAIAMHLRQIAFVFSQVPQQKSKS